jgi:hypothetical protein
MKPLVTLSVERIKKGETKTFEAFLIAQEPEKDGFLLLLASEPRGETVEGIGERMTNPDDHEEDDD